MSELSVKALETRKDSQILFNRRRTINFASSLKFWTPVFSQVNIVQELVQNPSISFVDTVQHLNALKNILQELRTTLPQEVSQKALTNDAWWGIDVNRRIGRKRKCLLSPLKTRD